MTSKSFLGKVTNILLKHKAYNLSFENSRFKLNYENEGIGNRVLLSDNKEDNIVGYMVFDGPKWVENPFNDDMFWGFDSYVDNTSMNERLRNQENRDEASNCTFYVDSDYRDSSNQFTGISKVITTVSLSIMMNMLKKEKRFHKQDFIFALLDSRTRILEKHYECEKFMHPHSNHPDYFTRGNVEFPEFEIKKIY